MIGITRRGVAALVAVAIASVPAAAGAQQRARTPTRADQVSALGLHGFSVVLVVGTLSGQGPTSSEGVPESAKKALSDMKDFLPYKRYQLLDAAWMLCCGSPGGVSGRVRGPDDREYTYHVDPIGAEAPKLNIRFSIRESGEPPAPALNATKISDTAKLEHSRQLYDAQREREEMEVQLRSVKQKFEVGLATGPEMEAAAVRSRRAEQRVQELQRMAGSTRPSARPGQNIMDSTFAIAVGETVVVGTSRLNGDRALIAILTAAAKPVPVR